MNRSGIRSVVAAVLSGSLFTFSAPIGAQQSTALLGAWERIALRSAQGVSLQPPASPAFLILADGHFIQVIIPDGRPKVAKPIAEMTREELLSRFTGVVARRGTYTVQDSVITRVDEANSDPNAEGRRDVQSFRIEGDVLILRESGGVEARFRRLK